METCSHSDSSGKLSAKAGVKKFQTSKKKNNNCEDYIKKSTKKLIIVASNNTDNIKTNRTTKTKKQKGEEKQMNVYFKQYTDKISHEDLDKGNL